MPISPGCRLDDAVEQDEWTAMLGVKDIDTLADLYISTPEQAFEYNGGPKYPSMIDSQQN